MKCYRDKDRVCASDCVAFVNIRKFKFIEDFPQQTSCRIINLQHETMCELAHINSRMSDEK
jgi:hypothetical protein